MTKYLNELTIALLIVAALGALISASMLITNAKALARSYAEAEAIPMKLPSLSRQSIPYTQSQYQQVKAVVEVSEHIKLDASSEKLLIHADSIHHEAEWRRAVAAALAFDRNLHARRVCGSVTNTCAGSALVAEIVGQRQQVSVIN